MLISGYTPFPLLPENDPRLPHLARKIQAQIQKTALGAESAQPWRRITDIAQVTRELKREGYTVVALEQATGATPLPAFLPPAKIVLIVGREVEGIEPEVLKLCDTIVEIPMFGRKESFNVVQAAAMGLYHCRFTLHKA